MSIELKTFQTNTLATLQRYFEKARLVGAEQAFMATAKDSSGRVPLYRTVAGIEGVPYVCLRLPTGGGKTILAAHAVRVAARSYLEKEHPVVLWLVPSNTIRTQTAEALKKAGHPYRQALDDAFDGRVAVFDISEIENIRPQDMVDRVCIIVATIQTLRVEKTDSRDVYAHKEAFEPHFGRFKSDAPELERFSDGPSAGKVKFSFANLLMIHQPMVIVDEAHNARTSLTFETLRRVSPSCIVELTATPDQSAKAGSNILYRVSASELKAEAMIKLPIVLTEHPTSWQDAVRDALLTRQRLAELAKNEADYVRPLLLIQAENKDKPANVEAIKQYLIENEKVDEANIVVATGEQRGLDGIDLFDKTCGVTVIITVQALKEGWDCSFAYVFCSTANISSGKDVEQLLGRVLRMPYAKRRKQDDLNKAYAHVASPVFGQAARDLQDSLVSKMGFEETEAEQFIQTQQPLPNMDDLPLFRETPPVVFTFDDAPDLSTVPEDEQQHIVVTTLDTGKVQVEVKGSISHAVAEQLAEAAPAAIKAEVKVKLAEHQRSLKAPVSPSMAGTAFVVPRLCVRIQDELELVERSLFLDAAGWDLLTYSAELPDFRFNDNAKTFEFDIDGERVVYEFKGGQQLDLSHVAGDWTANDLVRWLDKQLRQDDVGQTTMLGWLQKAVTYLIDHQRFDLVTLSRAKFILVRALADRIRAHREAAYKQGYQETLFAPTAAVETSFDYAFRFHPDAYPANGYCRSGYKWKKHYYPIPGELEGKGEEFECAQAIDMLPQVKHWVRNLERQPLASFWLPTSTDRFYPDFVAELEDGRLLVVEYKGGLTAQTDDTKEKRLLGELWEAKSGGKGLFMIAEKQDQLGRMVYDQLAVKVA